MKTLVDVSRRRSGPGILQFEDGTTIEIPRKVLEQIEIQSDEAYQLELLRKRIRQKSREVLESVARAYLSRYSKTSQEFVEHYRKKGYSEEVVRDTEHVLKREEYLNDKRVAREHVNHKIENKFIGRKRLIAELRQKGISQEMARNIVYERISDTDEQEMALEYARKNKNLSDQKMASRLRQRGFTGFAIGKIIRNRDSNHS